ncbi:MAG: DUF5011 domain-containing protein [Oscillospiraceae bacterium]|nr:DUF5011 domain-containing protein [Oscillospiraceae bacterium]
MGTDELTRDKTSRGWLIILVSVTLVMVVLITALLFLLVVNEFAVEIRMNGDPSVTLEFGESYEDPGASAVLRGSIILTDGLALDVRTEGTAPGLVLGRHQITYTASFGPWSGTVVRNVKVTDTQPPVITLFTNTAVFTRPGQPYREEGYLAVDNYDGDITDSVVVTEGDGIVTYTVTDSSGNCATVTRQIRYADPE